MGMNEHGLLTPLACMLQTYRNITVIRKWVLPARQSFGSEILQNPCHYYMFYFTSRRRYSYSIPALADLLSSLLLLLCVLHWQTHLTQYTQGSSKVRRRDLQPILGRSCCNTFCHLRVHNPYSSKLVLASRA